MDSWKEFKELEGIDGKYYCSDFYDISLNKLVFNVEQVSDFGNRKDGLMK